MAKRQFFNKENRTSFFLNFLAVVLGICLTFGGESLISHREERNNLKNCLELVSIELQDNRESLYYCDTLVNNELKAAIYLIEYEGRYSEAPADSLFAVANTPFIIEDISVYTDAFELLKSSGVLTKLKDKKLALDIFSTYNALDGIVSYLNLFYNHKTKYLEPAMSDNVKKILAGDNVTAENLWSAITASKEGQQFLREVVRFLSTYDADEIHTMIDNTIVEIDSFTR